MATYDLTPEQKKKERARYDQLLKEGHTSGSAVYVLDNERSQPKRISTDPISREQNRKNNREKLKKIGGGILSGIGKIAKSMGENIAHNRRVSSSGGRRKSKRSQYYDDSGSTPDVYGGDMLSGAMGLGSGPSKKRKIGRKQHSSGRKSSKSHRGKQIIINL